LERREFKTNGGNLASVARKLVNKAIEEYSKQVKGKVLFIGVSRAYGEMYSKMFDEFVTMDIDPRTNPDIVGNIQKCPEIPDESFDGLIMTGVWEYLTYQEKAIAEIHRVLKSGNTALLCVPGPALYHDKPTVKLNYIMLDMMPLRIEKVEIIYYKNQIVPFYMAAVIRKVAGK
jgi:SAM-dependent methyltransferase